MRNSTALVGPLPTVRFQDGTRIVADPPKNTLDSRYEFCTDHHTACVCREAELNETIAEYRALYREAVDAVNEILAGHVTFPEYGRIKRAYWAGSELVREWEYDETIVCQCTGCQIARKAWLR